MPSAHHTPHPPSQLPPLLRAHATRLLGGWLHAAQADGWLRFQPSDGGVVWPEEVERLLQARSRAMSGPPLTLPAPCSPAACWEALKEGVEAALMRGDDPLADRWSDLLQRLHLDPIEAQALALLVALDLDQALARAWRYGWANAMQAAPSWGFIARLLAHEHPDRSNRALAPARSALFRRGLLTLHSDTPNTPLSERLLALAPEVTPTLLGWAPPPKPLRPFDAIAHPPKRIGASLRPRLRALLQGSRPLRCAVHGPPGSGRLPIAAQLAQGAGVREGLWVVDLGRAIAQGSGDAALAHALRASALYDVALVFTGLDRLGDQEQRWVEAVDDRLADANAPLIWALTSPPNAYFDLAPHAVLGIGYPPKRERLDVWRDALADRPVSDALLRQLAGQHLLSEGQIQGVASRALAQHGERPLDAALVEDARAAAQLGLGRLATPETGRVQLSQLVVDAETQTALEEIISYTSHRHRLMTDWGFGDKLSYGLGVTCLFAGPPGTGKTFGAQAIATALNLELYRVDISQLVSKYIGETEKHLAALFDAAEQGEVLLLFDEADSLFGKRTEVKTSVDRYANLEVNYLLQRIERFEGVTVLTTNFEAGLDEAFARRIRFKVAFDAPDETARRRLWRALLPSRIPLAKCVDLDALAAHFELSGGHIKEALLRAASLAMSRDKAKLTQALLWRSANVEYKKLGKLLVSDDLR